MWNSGKIWLVMLLLILTIGVKGVAGRQEPEGNDYQLAPRTGILIEYGGFLLHDDPFTSRLRRRLEIDLLQYRRFIVYLEIDEETWFGTPPYPWEFNRIIYRLHGGLRYDLGNYYVGIFYRHWCANNFLTEKYPSSVNRINYSIYFITLEFLSKAMRAGMKDRGIVFDPHRPFEFLGHWHFGFWVSKTVSQPTVADIDWVIRAQVRYDLLRYRRFVPYLEAGGELRIGSTSRLGPWIEVGARYHIRSHLDLTPFFQWRIDQENRFYKYPTLQKVERQYLLGGLRMEYLLDSRDFSDDLKEGWQFLPEIHGTAIYLKYLRSSFFGWAGKIELNLEVLRNNPWTLFFYNNLNLDTERYGATGFGPDKLIYWMQYGLTYTKEPYFIECFVKHSKRLDARKYSSVSERTNLAGLRLGTRGMKPGHSDDAISFTGPRFQWLNKWNGQVSVGHYFQNRDWQYLWNTSMTVRWDLCRWRFLVPYLQGELGWLIGGGQTGDVVEYAAETGVRLHGVGDIVPYFRFQHQENARFFRGPADTQTLFGVKYLF